MHTVSAHSDNPEPLVSSSTPESPDYRPLGYSDPVPSAVIRRERKRSRTWNADAQPVVLRISRGKLVRVAATQLVDILEYLVKTYPYLKPRKAVRTLTLEEIRSIFDGRD